MRNYKRLKTRRNSMIRDTKSVTLDRKWQGFKSWQDAQDRVDNPIDKKIFKYALDAADYNLDRLKNEVKYKQYNERTLNAELKALQSFMGNEYEIEDFDVEELKHMSTQEFAEVMKAEIDEYRREHKNDSKKAVRQYIAQYYFGS